MLEKIVDYQHFLLFVQCFQMVCSSGSLNVGIVWLRVNYLPNEIFRLIQIASICSLQNKCEIKIETSCWKGRKQCGKRRKYWLPVFSPLPTMF